MAMMRRVRGVLLRLARKRSLSILFGLVLVVPAAWVEFVADFGPLWQGLALIVGATGVALIWTGLSGARPDWVDQ